MSRALRQVLTCPDLSEVIVVAPADHLSEFTDLLSKVGSSGVSVRVVAGGGRRSDSVAIGVAALSEHIDLVLVHDAARALTPATVFGRVVGALRANHDAVVPVLPVTDTIKEVGPVRADGLAEVVRTIDRTSLRAVQTPQGFRRPVLERAHEVAAGAVTDDAALVEQHGGVVTTVPGDVLAMKITTAHDLAAAAQWLDEAPR